MTVSGWDKSLKNYKTAIKNTLKQWQWHPAWNDEDLGQSALTEAHGDYVGDRISPWEPQIGKRRWFFMHANRALLGEHGHNGKAQALGCMGESKNRWRKEKSAKRTKAGPVLQKPVVLIGAPSNALVLSGFFSFTTISKNCLHEFIILFICPEFMRV